MAEFYNQNWDQWAKGAFNVPSIQNPNPTQPTVAKTQSVKSWRDYANDSLDQSKADQEQQLQQPQDALAPASIDYNWVNPLSFSPLKAGESPEAKPIATNNNITSTGFSNRFGGK